MFQESFSMINYRNRNNFSFKSDYSGVLFKKILGEGVKDYGGEVYLNFFLIKNGGIKKLPKHDKDILSSSDPLEAEGSINGFSISDYYKEKSKKKYSKKLTFMLEQAIFFTIRVYTLISNAKIKREICCIIGIDEEWENITWKMHSKENGEWFGEGWKDIDQPIVIFERKDDVISFKNLLN